MSVTEISAAVIITFNSIRWLVNKFKDRKLNEIKDHKDIIFTAYENMKLVHTDFQKNLIILQNKIEKGEDYDNIQFWWREQGTEFRSIRRELESFKHDINYQVNTKKKLSVEEGRVIDFIYAIINYFNFITIFLLGVNPSVSPSLYGMIESEITQKLRDNKNEQGMVELLISLNKNVDTEWEIIITKYKLVQSILT